DLGDDVERAADGEGADEAPEHRANAAAWDAGRPGVIDAVVELGVTVMGRGRSSNLAQLVVVLIVGGLSVSSVPALVHAHTSASTLGFSKERSRREAIWAEGPVRALTARRGPPEARGPGARMGGPAARTRAGAGTPDRLRRREGRSKARARQRRVAGP